MRPVAHNDIRVHVSIDGSGHPFGNHRGHARCRANHVPHGIGNSRIHSDSGPTVRRFSGPAEGSDLDLSAGYQNVAASNAKFRPPSPARAKLWNVA